MTKSYQFLLDKVFRICRTFYYPNAYNDYPYVFGNRLQKDEVSQLLASKIDSTLKLFAGLSFFLFF